MKWRVVGTDAVAGLGLLPDRSAHSLCTSIPFWGQREYEVEGAHGMEPSRSEWANAISGVMDVARDKLRDDGTAFVVVGETYTVRPIPGDIGVSEVSLQAPYLAERLRARGWSIKSLVVIEYTNPAPTSPHNRPVQSHHYGILLAKKPTGFFWDFVSSRERGVAHDRLMRSVWIGKTEKTYQDDSGFKHGSAYPRWIPDRYLSAAVCEAGVCADCGAPRRPVIAKATGGSTGKSWLEHGDDLVKGNAKTASSAGYVPARIESWEDGCGCGADSAPPLVIDPYAGTSTTGISALDRDCMYYGVDLDPRCVKTSQKRLSEHLDSMSQGLFDSERSSRRQSIMFKAAQ